MENNENNVSNPNAWTFFADKDIKAAETLISDIELTGEVAYLCQQATEKYLKAFLAKNRIIIKKTHDLGQLYSKVKLMKDLNLDEVLLEQLATLYIEARYPGNVSLLSDGTLPTKEKAQIYLDFAKKVAGIIKVELE